MTGIEAINLVADAGLTQISVAEKLDVTRSALELQFRKPKISVRYEFAIRYAVDLLVAEGKPAVQ